MREFVSGIESMDPLVCESLSLRKQKLSLSFSGCGFLCVYHAGVAAAIKEYAPYLLENQVSGASAGSIVAACLLSNVCMSQGTSIILNVVAQARSYTFGALNRDFDLLEVVRKDLDVVLPENAHELCTGRLRISLTRFSDMKNVIISEFSSKAELIQAIVCSCFIPVYGGFVYPKFRGVTYIDGGVTDNQPKLDSNTITVSPFSGENDICPSDADSASMFNFMFSGTSIRFTSDNLYRIMVCLFPPPTDVCSRICRQGFEDALKYLTRNGLAPCARCLTVQADVVSIPTTQPAYQKKSRAGLRRSSVTSNNGRWRNISECESCSEVATPLSRTQTSELFPKIMERPFEEAEKEDSSHDSNMFSSKLFQMAQLITIPLTAYVQLLKFCRSLIMFLGNYAMKDWFAARIAQIVKLIINELSAQKDMYSARLSRQLDITETEYSGVGAFTSYRGLLPAIGMSLEARKEYEFLQMKDSLVTKGKIRNSVQPKAAKLAEEEEVLDDAISVCGEDDDSFVHVVNYAKQHDAVLAYYYMDDDRKMHVCEIFGVDRPDKRHTCHSHLCRSGTTPSSIGSCCSDCS